jgi:hypothetical protein
METSSLKLDELRQRILAAFPKNDPPLPENITSHPCEECYGIRDDFRGVRWWAADDELIDENFDDLPLFTPEAYHYYLPAFLLRALDTFDPDNLVVQFCVYNLSPTKTPVDDPWYRARLNQFTSEQISVIAKFLVYIQEDEKFYDYYADVERGLRKFWRVAKDENAI